MKLHEKIHYYRTLAKLSQEELAALVGVSRQAVSKWELGEATPEVSKLMALARAFGVTTDELLSEEPPALGAQYRPEPEPQPEEAAAPETDSFAQATGFLGRLIRRYGWLAGVRIAMSGLGFVVFGIVGLLLVSSFTQRVNASFGDFGGFGGGMESYITMPDGSIQSFHQSSTGDIVLGGSGGGGFGSFMAIIPGAALLIGIVLIIGGAVLAVELRRKRED